MYRFDPLYESVNLLVSDVDSSEHSRAATRARLLLEDASSPTTRKYQEKLFKAVIEKGHIDFSGIEQSQGDITQYSGYSNMMETLNAIDKIADDQNSFAVKKYTATIKKAIGYISGLSATYQRGFQLNNEFVTLEYNLYTYACIEATSAIIYEFVDYIKRPNKPVMTITLKNTVIRANLFLFQQLEKFNKVQENMGMDYRKMLEVALNKGKNNFLGNDMAIGYTAISLVALAIIPISREIVYQFYNWRKNLSQTLELQANFLEMNRLSVQNSEILTQEKRAKVVQQQETLAKRLRKLSSVLKVEAVTASKKAKKELEKENKDMTLAKTTEDIENSPITLF